MCRWRRTGTRRRCGRPCACCRFPRDCLAALLAPLDRREVLQQPAPGHSRSGPAGARPQELGITVSMGMALRRGKEMIGFHWPPATLGRREPFTPQQERIARGIAQIASMALENARLVEELDRASRVKSDFVATMSHELRTPLNVIVGYNDLLLDGAFGDADVRTGRRRCGASNSSAHQLLELINTTLDVSRLEAGRLPLDLEACRARRRCSRRSTPRRASCARAAPGWQFAWNVAADVAVPAHRSDEAEGGAEESDRQRRQVHRARHRDV